MRLAAAPLAALLAVLTLTACADEDGGRTAEALACLSYGNERRVAEAAVLHGIAEAGSTPGTVSVGGRDQTPSDWRKRDPDRFAEACAIVVSANQLAAGSSTGSSGSSGGSVWAVLWPLIVGAVLTLVTTFATTGWRDRLAEARLHSAALRSAAAQYASVVDAFLDVATDRRQPEPTGAELDDPRRGLRRVLDETPRPHGIPAIATAGRLLETGVLNHDLAAGWAAPEARSPAGARVVAVRAGLAELRSAVNAITVAQERPLRTAVGRVLATVRARIRPRRVVRGTSSSAAQPDTVTSGSNQ